ncbi:MAG: endonuclease VII domain-containing protein [Proteobacteria bacterium]|jgi:hypothetical protein|nr:endonuclease VII domain-containing protein [Pseudomonadota bacterium]
MTDKEKRKLYNAKYRASHKEESKAYGAKYRSLHKEEVYGKQKEWKDAHKKELAEKQRKRRQSNPDKYQKYNTEEYKKILTGLRYKLNADQIECVYSLTNCPICEREFIQGATSKKRIDGKKCKRVIDHDHTTGNVRGVICHHCNVMLGHAQDNVDTLINAIKYLNGELKNIEV